MNRKTVLLAVLVLAVAVPLAYVTCQNQRQLNPDNQGADETRTLLQRNLDLLKQRGIVERAANGECIVGSAFTGLDQVAKDSALLLAYQAAWDSWPPGQPPAMHVRTLDGQHLGTFTPDSGLLP